MRNYLLDDWMEAEIPFAGGMGGPQPEMPSAVPGGSDAMATGNMDNGNVDPNIGNVDQMQAQGAEQPQNVSDDPEVPDMPQEKDNVEDFEVWKNQYYAESMKGDATKLHDMLNQVRDKDGLDPYQRKFVEDNYNIQLLRMGNSNINQASRDIRKNVKDQIDLNNPATSMVNHITAVLETQPSLNNIFIKLKGYNALKADLHRKYMAALIGGVQVGSGTGTEDVVFCDKEYTVEMCTRYNARFGDILLEMWWAMKEDDPGRFLSDSERKRLNEGAPDEKDVLRKRLVIESLAHTLKTRAYIVHVVNEDGTIFALGWDIAGSIKAAYTEGKIKVKLKATDNSEAFITDEGNIVPYMDLDIVYTKETGEQNEDGSPEVTELAFLERRNGSLFLAAELQTLRDAANSIQGMVLKEIPYNGNPSDLKVLSRCVYSTYEMLMRQC